MNKNQKIVALMAGLMALSASSIYSHGLSFGVDFAAPVRHVCYEPNVVYCQAPDTVCYEQTVVRCKPVRRHRVHRRVRSCRSHFRPSFNVGFGFGFGGRHFC